MTGAKRKVHSDDTHRRSDKATAPITHIPTNRSIDCRPRPDDSKSQRPREKPVERQNYAWLKMRECRSKLEETWFLFCQVLLGRQYSRFLDPIYQSVCHDLIAKRI